MTEAISDFLAPHKHASQTLWQHANPESKEIYDQLVADGQVAAEQAIQAALGVVTAGDWPTLDDCIPEGIHWRWPALVRLFENSVQRASGKPAKICVSAWHELTGHARKAEPENSTPFASTMKS